MPFVLTYLVLIWGINFLFMKWVLVYVSPAQMVLVRLALGFAVVLAFALATRQLRREHLRHSGHFAVMACLAGALYFYCFAVGTGLLPSGIAGAISGAVPLCAMFGAMLLLRDEALSLRKASGILVGFFGVFLLSRPFDFQGAEVSATGVIYMLAGALSLGLSFVYVRRFITPLGIPAVALATYQLGIATVAMAIVTDLDGMLAIRADPIALAALLAGLGIFGTGIAYVGYYTLVERLGAVRASAVTYGPPVVALLVASLFLDEPIGWLDYAATALILGAVWLLRRPQTSRAR